MYSFGGQQDGTYEGFSGAYKYDLVSDAWDPISNLNQGRYIAAVAVLSDHEILIAGT